MKKLLQKISALTWWSNQLDLTDPQRVKIEEDIAYCRRKLKIKITVRSHK